MMHVIQQHIFFQFLGALCTQGPQTSAKNANLKNLKLESTLNLKLDQFEQKALKFYVLNHKFNVFKRFWKQKKKSFLP